MPTIAPTTSAQLNELVKHDDFDLANGDQTETYETDDLAAAVIVANVAMEIHIPSKDGTYSARPPSGSAIWVEPTATLAGHLITVLPPRFFVRNNSGGAGKCSISLIGRQQSGAVPAPA